MSNTLSIDALEQHGACKPDCIALREIFPSGTVVFDMSYYPQVRDLKINVFWGTPLLTKPVQLALALAWYDRALNGQTPTWKAALRALVATPDAGAASTQLGLRLADRRAADPKNELETAMAGVGYAAAAAAGKFAESPIDPARTQSAMIVLSQWCARCAALIETGVMDTVLDELQSSIWQALTDHGATFPR
jgi:hypothetical protein